MLEERSLGPASPGAVPPVLSAAPSLPMPHATAREVVDRLESELVHVDRLLGTDLPAGGDGLAAAEDTTSAVSGSPEPPD